MIHLLGPGGAGKTTAGKEVADVLACPFLDLDRLFEQRHGSIDDFIDRHGYHAYAAANVDVYLDVDSTTSGVLAVSSGFLAYPATTHARLPAAWKSLLSSQSTFVLLPSFDLETCVIEILRRQAKRRLPVRRSREREEAVIRGRFPIYAALPAKRIATMQPVADIAKEIIALVAAL